MSFTKNCEPIAYSGPKLTVFFVDRNAFAISTNAIVCKPKPCRIECRNKLSSKAPGFRGFTKSSPKIPIVDLREVFSDDEHGHSRGQPSMLLTVRSRGALVALIVDHTELVPGDSLVVPNAWSLGLSEDFLKKSGYALNLPSRSSDPRPTLVSVLDLRKLIPQF